MMSVHIIDMTMLGSLLDTVARQLPPAAKFTLRLKLVALGASNCMAAPLPLFSSAEIGPGLSAGSTAPASA